MQELYCLISQYLCLLYATLPLLTSASPLTSSNLSNTSVLSSSSAPNNTSSSNDFFEQALILGTARIHLAYPTANLMEIGAHSVLLSPSRQASDFRELGVRALTPFGETVSTFNLGGSPSEWSRPQKTREGPKRQLTFQTGDVRVSLGEAFGILYGGGETRGAVAVVLSCARTPRFAPATQTQPYYSFEFLKTAGGIERGGAAIGAKDGRLYLLRSSSSDGGGGQTVSGDGDVQIPANGTGSDGY